MNYDKLIDELSIDELKEMVTDVNCWNGQLDDFNYYENDEYFFRDFFGDRVDEAVRATYYGDYNYMDSYVRFNAYGNLDSISDYALDQEIQDNAQEIIEAYIDNIDDMYDGELKRKIKDFIEEEESEEE